MKKVILLSLCLALLFTLAACGGNKAPTETDPTEESTVPAEPAGTLLVSLNSTVEMIYDENGKLLEIKGTDEASNTVAADLQSNLGRACVIGVRALMRYYSDANLIGDAKTLVVRVGVGDPLPAPDFLDTIVIDTQLLADEEGTGVRVQKAGDQELDENGLLLASTAKAFAARFLGATAEELTGEDTAADNVYTYTFGDKICTVDAMTGLVLAK